MSSNDMDSSVFDHGNCISQMGPANCKAPEQESEEQFEYVSTGYRWVQVNRGLHIYMSVSVGREVSTEILAYVQLLPSGKFRALRCNKGVNIVMPIPYGPAKKMISLAELYILVERSDKTLRA